jgi:carbon-monoxide dehydrogenase iron sulfur subunit
MLILDLSKCSGCRRCEVQCSFHRMGRVGRGISRIKVAKIEETGIDFPVFCQLCRERYCMDCPQAAMTVGPLGQVTVDPDSCVGCGTCEALCPIGAIEIQEEIPFVCDLCQGDPRCVRACTMGALTFAPDEVETVSLEIQDGGLNPEEKRVRFALSSSRPLREKWVLVRSA